MIAPYTLLRSKRRTLTLTVTDDARLIVRAPLRAPLGSIEGFIAQKDAWIRKILARLENQPKPKGFADGETFFYFGIPRDLRIQMDAPKQFLFLEGEFVAREAPPESIRDRFVRFFRKEARSHIQARVKVLAGQFNFSPKSVRITSAVRRWGSCSWDNRLNFTWRLMMAPPSVIDYVIVHELAHIRHKNHSDKFWDSVASMCPNYRDEKRWLTDHRTELVFP